MEHKSSHEGHKMGEACGHLRKMQAEHGVPAAAGNKPVGGAKQPMKAIKAMGRAGRKDG
jgi:hypothetical protein